jgi:hypothetical protein
MPCKPCDSGNCESCDDIFVDEHGDRTFCGCDHNKP